MTSSALLAAERVGVTYAAAHGARVQAVHQVSLEVAEGETLGLVGESGCGKSSLGRALLQMPAPTTGRVLLRGQDLTRLRGAALRQVRSDLQMIFQDPVSSLNPRRRVRDIVAEPLQIWRRGDAASRRAAVEEALAAVGLEPDDAGPRRPHEFSGGQCQRICIARALVLRPSLLICDEPVSALDVSVQAQVLNLLEDLKAAYSLTMIFIAHDLSVVKNVADRVVVMYLGAVCEVAPSDELYARPRHPYTQALFRAIPVPDPRVRPVDTTMPGEPPSPSNPPSGCRFRTRCPRSDALCAQVEPPLRELGPGHVTACHHPLP